MELVIVPLAFGLAVPIVSEVIIPKGLASNVVLFYFWLYLGIIVVISYWIKKDL